MNVLVTGAEGYIGVLLCSYLLERGHEVTGLDTGYCRGGWLYNGVMPFPAVISQDIRTVTAEDLHGYDAVVHLAELSNDPLGQFKPEITFDINYVGSVALAKRCLEAGVTRFVYASSCSVYGVGSGELKTEQSATNPQTVYATCKVLVEKAVAALANDDFSPTFLRNATAYGPSPSMRFDIVLNNFAGLAWTTQEITMTSDGSPWRPLVHVLDICEAIARTLEAPRETIHAQIFNVGDSRENYQVKDIARVVAETFCGCRVILGSSDNDKRSYRVSFDKINTQLPGFQCRRNAQMGASQLLELFESIAMSPEVFTSRAYTRLQQLTYLLQTQRIDERFFWQ